MFDDRWSATVDGAAAPVLRAEDFFMAVTLPPGEHTVAFRFRDRVFLAGLAVSALTLAGMMGWGWYRRRRRPAPGGRNEDDSGPAVPGGA